jgi:hypothetical protein
MLDTEPPTLSSERISTYEICPRRMAWMDQFTLPFISPMRALHIALDAGLRTAADSPERIAENTVLELARSPGLDLIGNVYSLAMHYAKLAGVLTTALRGPSPKGPWLPVDSVTLSGGSTWKSACYRVPDAELPVRIALVDRWTDDRSRSELGGWRTVGEVCALNTPITLTSLNIGPALHQRRHSAWTRCYRHPRNRTFRFQRKRTDEDFSRTWARIWREDCDLGTRAWLDKMHEDGCMDNLVAHVTVPIPERRVAYLLELERMAKGIRDLPAIPEMRLAGCWGLSPCPFTVVCPGIDPGLWGFRLRTSHNTAAAAFLPDPANPRPAISTVPPEAVPR